MLSYTLHICLSLLNSRKLRNKVRSSSVAHTTLPHPAPAPPTPPQVLTLLAELHMSAEKPDYIAVTQSYIFLDQPQSMADILVKLAKGSEVCACALWVGWAAATAVCWTPPPGDCRRTPLWPTR